MNVDAADPRDVERSLGENQSVCGDDQQVEIVFLKRVKCFRLSERARLFDRDAELGCDQLYGRRLEPLASAGGPVRLREDSNRPQ